LHFSDGSTLVAEYWRVTRRGEASVSSFDHRQQYGLPAPIDAVHELQRQLEGKTVTEAQLDGETGDLIFRFNENVKVQMLNLTGYEDWEMRFPDGTGEYSNYAK